MLAEWQGVETVTKQLKKAWTTPELKKIAAGSAETGTLKSNDGGGAMNNHS